VLGDRTVVAGIQIPGSRELQEDCLCFQEFSCGGNDSGLLLVLCDGMGGSAGGEIASQLVCDTVVETMLAQESIVPWRLIAAMEAANRKLAARVQAQGHLAGMGTTLVVAVICGHQMYWLSVGDSPLWLFRDGRLLRLNADHSMRAVLSQKVEAKEITRAEAERDVTRHYLLSALCGTPPPMVDHCQEAYGLRPGDRLLLASDGVETLSESHICQVLQQDIAAKPAAVLAALMTGIEEQRHPLQDNASAILVHVGAEAAQGTSEQRLPDTTGKLHRLFGQKPTCVVAISTALLLAAFIVVIILNHQ